MATQARGPRSSRRDATQADSWEELRKCLEGKKCEGLRESESGLPPSSQVAENKAYNRQAGP